MVDKQGFLRTLKVDDEIFLSFPNYYLEGKVIELNELKNIIKLSNVKISGTQLDKEITLYTQELLIVGWGKK